jgi:hypothetical protein
MKQSTGILAPRLLFPTLAILVISGCLPQGPLEDQLADAVLNTWAGEGVTLLGNIGPNPISTVEETGDRSRAVTFSDPDALGGEVTWDVEIVQVEAYPLFSGGPFASAIHDRSVAQNRRNGLPSSMRDQVDRGRLLAIGEFRGKASSRGRAGEVSFQRVAVLDSGGAGSSPVWVFEQENRDHSMLWQATKLTYDFLMTRDERVMTCAGDVDGTSPMEIRRDCAVRVMETDLGGGG